jgi:hypothetical protein
MKKRQSLSAVSLAINTTMASYQNGLALIEKATQPEFSIKIANTLEEREAAFRLGYQVYLEKGYISENPNKWLVQKYDSNSETVIFIVQDQQKNIAGTATLVFDGVSKIPAENIYASELDELRASGCTLTEASRLVISPDYRNSKEIIILLFNYILIYIYHVKGFNALTIQVNPRHKQYYKSLLNFNEIGDEKACPQVQNAPAVLLHLPMSKYQSEIKHLADINSAGKKERSLYQHFLRSEQESLVAYYLEKQTQPISAYEKQYFGLKPSNVGQAVAV